MWTSLPIAHWSSSRLGIEPKTPRWLVQAQPPAHWGISSHPSGDLEPTQGGTVGTEKKSKVCGVRLELLANAKFRHEEGREGVGRSSGVLSVSCSSETVRRSVPMPPRTNKKQSANKGRTCDLSCRRTSLIQDFPVPESQPFPSSPLLRSCLPVPDQGDDRAQGLLHGRAEPDAARLNAQLLPCRGKARDRPVSRKVADFDIQHGGL